jgi:predicted NBD/HSP70 family sugar kinase
LGYIPTHRSESLLNGKQATHLGEYYHLPRLYERLQEDGFDVSTPSDLAVPFEEESPVLLDWLDTVTRQLAPLLVSIEYLIDPAVFVFGGRLPDPLINALMERLEKRLQNLRTNARPAIASLRQASSGEDAAAMGVATLPIYDLFAPAPHLLFKEQGPQPQSLSS